MANVVISPNMNLPVPVVSVDPGPDWAQNVNSCLGAVDSHNHTTGQGVPITPAAININSDLAINNNNLITARSLRFNPQGSALAGPADLGCLFEQGVDLYYIDGSGNVIRLTQSGAPAGATGTITGLPSGTASASFAGTTFTFQSSTNTPASMNVGPVTIGQAVASGFGVTISANVAEAANYALTLPVALPLGQSAPVSDVSGNLSFLPLASGSFTPTVSAVANVIAITVVQDLFYTRIGNYVSCYGTFNISGSNGALVVARISLPIVAVFATSADLQGLGTQTALGTDLEVTMYAAPSVNEAELFFYGNGFSNTLNYSFSYKIS